MVKRFLFILCIGSIIALPPVWKTLESIALILRSLDVNQVVTYIRSFHILAPIVSFFLMAFCVLTPFPSFLITFANSAVFGWGFGAALSWSGAMLGAIGCFLLAKYMGRAAVERLTSKTALDTVDTFFEEYGKNTVFIARLLPFLSFSLVSYGAGLTSIRVVPYLVATGIGQLPATLIYSYVGKMLSGGIKYIVIGLLCFIAFSALLYTVKKYYTAKKKNISLTNKKSAREQKEKKIRKIVRNFQKKTSSDILSQTLSIATGTYKHIAFLPGCSLAFHSPLLIQKTYLYLSKSFPGISLILRCCANPTFSIGDKEYFKKFYQLLENELEKNEITSIITACPNCYSTIKEHSPHITVLSLYTVLCKTDIPKHDYSNMPKAALHDPCPTKEKKEIHTCVRKILDDLQYPYEEFDSPHNNISCCGNKRMLALTDKKRAYAIMKKRCNQTPCSHIISYCQSCVSSLNKEGKTSFHLLELLFSEQNTMVTSHSSSFLQRWYNRFYAKKLVSSLERQEG